MERERSSIEDLFSKSVGVAIAVGALAVGVVAAVANQERARQIRADVQTQIDDLSRRVDDLSAQATRVIQEKRPDIEETIARSRRVVVDGLEKARTVVEQGADKAQEYVHKASQQSSGSASAVDDVVENAHNGSEDHNTGAETRDFNVNGNGTGEGPH